MTPACQTWFRTAGKFLVAIADVPGERSMVDPPDVLTVVARRSDILRTLQAEPRERHVLVDHVDASKSTVYKGVSQLRDLGLVEATEDGLEPTLFGTVALDRYEAFARAADLADVLSALPAEAIDPPALVGADSVVPDSTDTTRHHEEIAALLEEATTVRGFSPAIAPTYVSTIYDRLDEDGFALEFVLPRHLVEFLRTDRQAALDDIRASNSATLYETDADVPLTLLLMDMDEGTQVCIEPGEDADAIGLVRNDTDEARRWGERAFERVRETAEPVGSDSSPPS